MMVPTTSDATVTLTKVRKTLGNILNSPQAGLLSPFVLERER
jgi:hypothetical protein